LLPPFDIEVTLKSIISSPNIPFSVWSGEIAILGNIKDIVENLILILML